MPVLLQNIVVTCEAWHMGACVVAAVAWLSLGAGDALAGEDKLVELMMAESVVGADEPP